MENQTSKVLNDLRHKISIIEADHKVTFKFLNKLSINKHKNILIYLLSTLNFTKIRSF